MSAPPLVAEICVLGGGVLGAAIARAAARRGVATTLLEKSFVGSGVSAGNTGIACTMLGIQEDTEEWRCLTEGRPLNLPTYQSLGIPHRSTGALYVAWSPEEFRALDVLQGQEAKSEMVSPEDLRLRQPKLAAAKGALFVPEEVTVDPGLVVLAYAADAVRHGAAIFEETEVLRAERKGRRWELTLSDTRVLHADHVVNATGLGADCVEALQAGASLRFQPRRGDFLLFRRPTADTEPPISAPIGSVPTPAARGVYVWPTVHGDVVVGPTNVKQDDLALEETSQEVAAALHEKALQVCPALADWQVAGSYAGLRPALHPQQFGSDFVVRTDEALGWSMVAGVRSTGLTASLGLAERLLARLMPSRPFAATSSPALPMLADLAANFAARNDGCVEVAGRPWRVLHPQTRLGLTVTGGLASVPPGPARRGLGSSSWLQGDSASWMLWAWRTLSL